MTGIVEEVADPGSIAMLKTINSCRVLGNIPGYSSLLFKA
jgi:hypothetical protein